MKYNTTRFPLIYIYIYIYIYIFGFSQEGKVLQKMEDNDS